MSNSYYLDDYDELFTPKKCPEDCDGDCERDADGLPCALVKKCTHEWVEYVGLICVEVYCKLCGEVKNGK